MSKVKVKYPKPKHHAIARCEVCASMYITYISVSKSTPLAVTGPHRQLASLVYSTKSLILKLYFIFGKLYLYSWSKILFENEATVETFLYYYELARDHPPVVTGVWCIDWVPCQWGSHPGSHAYKRIIILQYGTKVSGCVCPSSNYSTIPTLTLTHMN